MHDLQVFFQIFRGQAGQFSGFGQGNGDGAPAVDIKPVVGEDCIMGFQAQTDTLFKGEIPLADRGGNPFVFPVIGIGNDTLPKQHLHGRAGNGAGIAAVFVNHGP